MLQFRTARGNATSTAGARKSLGRVRSRLRAPGEEIPRRTVRRPGGCVLALTAASAALAAPARELAGRSTSIPRRSSSTHGPIRRCSASTRSTRSCRRGTPGSARSRRRRPSCGRGARPSRNSWRGRGLLQDEPAQPGHRASRPVRAGHRGSGGRRARGEVAQHGPQPARRPVACRGPEPADRCCDLRSSPPTSPVATPARGGGAAARHARWRPRGRPSRGRRRGGARAAYVSSLRTQERLRAEQVRSVVVAGTGRPAEVADAAAADDFGAAASRRGRQLTVSATCYDLPGRTATGMPVGPGVVAVDPSVIPLGSQDVRPRLRQRRRGRHRRRDQGSGHRPLDDALPVRGLGPPHRHDHALLITLAPRKGGTSR